MAHILALAAGSDALLLGTRNQVLRSDGHSVASPYAIYEAR